MKTTEIKLTEFTLYNSLEFIIDHSDLDEHDAITRMLFRVERENTITLEEVKTLILRIQYRLISLTRVENK